MVLKSLNQEKSNLNPYNVLPPISSNQSSQDYYQNQDQNFDEKFDSYNYQNENFNNNYYENDSNVDTYLPVEPVYLNPSEEQSLINDIGQELNNVSSNQLKSLYSDMVKYDRSLNGFIDYKYVISNLKKNNVRNTTLILFIFL